MSGDKHCPICGRLFGKKGGPHECPQSVLNGIDAANSRAWNEDLEGRSPLEPYRTFERRLAEGVELMLVDTYGSTRKWNRHGYQALLNGDW